MAEQNKNLADQLNDQFSKEGFSKSFGGKYLGSEVQTRTYERVQKSDAMYQQFIRQNYGSYENFLQANKINQAAQVYDPTVDYIMDVRVVTEDQSYESDHISTQEVIMEALSGVCTVVFMKKDGSVGRITGTLDPDYIPQSESATRRQLFSPQRGDRVIMWDLNKQDWRSFYMDKVIKFVRDDTIGLE